VEISWRSGSTAGDFPFSSPSVVCAGTGIIPQRTDTVAFMDRPRRAGF
jgi:hypothetical protein